MKTNTDDKPARRISKKGDSGPDAPAGPEVFDSDRAGTQSDFIVVYGPDGTILYVNPAATAALGYAPEAMIGSPLLSFVAEEFRETMTANMEALRETGDPPFYETVLMAKNGLERSVIVKGRPVRYENRPAALLFLIDITERKALEEMLRQRADELFRTSNALRLSNKKLNLLSSITRHDINNQLTGLKFYLEMLESGQHDPVLADYCKKSITATDQIAAMIRFTRDYEEIGITAPVWLDCRALVDTVAKEAPLREVAIANEIPAGREVYADPLIAKVFYNLVDNAVRYGQTIKTIRFFLAEEEGKLTIVCGDDGVGIPEDEKEQIFNRGFGKNTGLGLALSREILDITGITIRETGTPGKGARFEITVPQESCRFAGGK